MYKLRVMFGMIIVVAIISSGSAYALPVVVGLGAFSGSETVIDFESIASGEAITTQFLADGVTFSNNGLFGVTDSSITTQFPSGGSVVAGNFVVDPVLGLVCCTDAVIAEFSSTITRVGFDIASGGSDDTTITAFVFSGGSPTATGTFTFTASPVMFFGLEDLSGIDGIAFQVLTQNPGAFAMNNFRFEGSVAPIPEPSTMILMGSGLVGLIWHNRRRKKEIA